MAFFPLFVSPEHHQGLTTFAVMAATIAVLSSCMFDRRAADHFLAERLRQPQRVGALQSCRLFLVGFW
jgi:threonine/homoserine/homoserine lactone efflux protein